MPLTIPVVSKITGLSKELIRVLPNVTFHEVKSLENDPHFKQSSILICDFDLLGQHLYDLPNARWIQGTWAGIDALVPYIEESKTMPFQVTRFTGEHFGKIMGEYVVTNIINHERNFFEVRENQKQKKWEKDDQIRDYRVIFDLTVGILGTGNIGNRIGKILHFLGAKVSAYGRKSHLPSHDEYSHISQYYTKDTLPNLLQECDYIVNVLPSTPETDNLLDNDILENCKHRKSVLINIGRGNIYSESSLVKALNNKWLSAAILDVFSTEPLPQTSPLWQMKEVFITPHVAGNSRAKDIAEQFQKNFTLYQNKLPLPAVIDFSKGY